MYLCQSLYFILFYFILFHFILFYFNFNFYIYLILFYFIFDQCTGASTSKDENFTKFAFRFCVDNVINKDLSDIVFGSQTSQNIVKIRKQASIYNFYTHSHTPPHTHTHTKGKLKDGEYFC